MERMKRTCKTCGEEKLVEKFGGRSLVCSRCRYLARKPAAVDKKKTEREIISEINKKLDELLDFLSTAN